MLGGGGSPKDDLLNRPYLIIKMGEVIRNPRFWNDIVGYWCMLKKNLYNFFFQIFFPLFPQGRFFQLRPPPSYWFFQNFLQNFFQNFFWKGPIWDLKKITMGDPRKNLKEINSGDPYLKKTYLGGPKEKIWKKN